MPEIDDEKRTTSDWVPRDGSSGRRATDRNQCTLHDYVFSKNDQSIGSINDKIKEEIERRDHKLELIEARLEHYITKWSLGIMVTITGVFVSIVCGIVLWQVKSLKEDVTSIGKAWIAGNQIAVESMNTITIEVVKIGAKQTGILKELEKLAPEHEMLMEHMKNER